MSTTPEESRELEEIRGVIAFGLDVQQFMGSQLGRFLQAKANAQIQDASEALLEVDPTNVKAIRDLQNRAAVANMFLLWIGEAVTEGENAIREFQSRGE